MNPHCVSPKRVDVLDPTPQPSLTLVTCYPFHAIGPTPQRFVVRADEISSPEQAAPEIVSSGWTASAGAPRPGRSGVEP